MASNLYKKVEWFHRLIIEDFLKFKNNHTNGVTYCM